MTDVAKLNVVVTADTSDAEKGLAGIQKAIGGFGSLATTALLGAGAAIAAAGAGAVKAAADFESTMAGVKAVSGATNDQMKQLSGLALQLGKDTTFSASEAAQGIEELVKGGLSIQDVMGGAAKATLNLAAAGGVDLRAAAEIAANALNTFNLRGDQMAHVSDLIAGAANASAIDVNDFKFAMAAAGAVAATTGFSIDSLSQAIAVMGRNGLKGQDAGTSLKTMMLNLQPATKNAQKAMRELGLYTDAAGSAFFDAQGHAKSFAEIASLLQSATRTLTDAQRLEALQTIFGTDAVRAAAIMAREGASGFGEMAAAMGKVTAESVAAERLNTLAGDIEQLKGSVETLAIAVGTALLPVLREVVQGATAAVNSLIPIATEWIPKITAQLQQKGLAGALADWIGALPALIAQVLTYLQQLGAALVNWVVPKIPILVGYLGQLARSVLGWVQQMEPLVVGQLVAWGRAFLDWVVPLVSQLPAALGALVGAVRDWIVQQAPAVLATLGGWARAFLDWVAPLVAALPGELAGVLSAALGWIRDNYRPILDQLGRWKDAFLDWIEPAIAAIPGALAPVKDAIVRWINEDALPAIGEAWTGFKDVSWPAIVASMEDARDRLRPVWADITKYFEDFAPTGQRIEELLATTAYIVDTQVRPVFEWLAGWVQAQGEDRQGFWKRFADNINATTERWANLLHFIGDVVKLYTDFLDYTDKVARRLGVPQIAIPQPPAIPPQTGGLPGGITTVPIGRDQGGPGRSGQVYAIGTGAQPELFVPSTPGTFVPAAAAPPAVPLYATIAIDGMQFATVNTVARQRYADRGGRPPPSWSR